MFMKVKNLAIAISLSCGAIAFLGQAAFAQQSVNGMDNQERTEYQTNEQDSMNGGFGNSFNAMDIIHRARMNRGRSMGDFEQESNTGIRNAADDFKRQQNERLQNQQQQPQTVNGDR
jgi:hypothetical protein